MMREKIEEIDQMLFEAGVLILSAKTVAQRKAADDKVMDARIALEKLHNFR